MFPDADKIKDKVRASLFSPEFNPEDIYKTTGWCGSQFGVASFVARSKTEVLNAIWIGVDTDLTLACILHFGVAPLQVVDNIFCIFFCFEITVRYFAYQQPCDAFKDFSFAFDFSLVLTMIWEVWVCSIIVVFMRCSDLLSDCTNLSVLRLLRLFRLVRIARVGRLMSSCRELVVLVKGIGMGLRSVLSTLFLMMVVIYVFAIIFTQLFRDTEEAEGCYENVLQSMNCLMLNVAACLGFGIFGRNTLSVWWNPRVRWLQKIWPPKRKKKTFAQLGCFARLVVWSKRDLAVYVMASLCRPFKVPWAVFAG
ncbi:unnamed protein product [Effrenium voratum]|nr:unnamed protein product [Effrenium voratum]